ncbi:hypothetical protein [Myxococcus sp. RHSTA-1-4]|uniref:hypothetical protein n=1 Tax=Myxococcus sp. RHSTA-1-4 TaxID=2874601 RepID=UPI001CBCA7EC|nr:hypothetical protein [Myxococcus sp. RHSTA-1-4]MBZ4417548.1 hypothetical protein [Myxococcus sp. RHSTA-1-4]
MRGLLLVAVVVLSGCARNQGWRPAPVEEDTSIVFPDLFDREAARMSAQSQPYELDGVLLRAIAIAANDFLPPDSTKRSCWNRQESYRYRVIKQGDVVFVRLSADPESCKPGPRMLDGGVKYAISTDGRILRRLFDGEPETLPTSEGPDAGMPETSSGPSIPVGDTTWGEPQPLPRWLDGGS